MGNHSQKLHRIDMLRLLGQDLPVKLLGLPQASGLVVLRCQSEGLLDRELGHAAGTIRRGLTFGNSTILDPKG